MNNEYYNFKSLSDQWWDEKGKFSILHKINPLRVKYIVNNISKNKNIKISNKEYLKNIKIIDIGSGGGLICEPLARLGAKISGIDFVKENIVVAKQHAKKENLNINYSFKNIKNLNYKIKYDVILLLEVIEHLDDWQNVIKKLNHLLKPKGIIIISTINRNLLSGITALFIAEKILKWIPNGTHNYYKLIKPKELTGALINSGFKKINLTGMVYNPILREWKLSKNNTKINYFCTAQKIS